MFYKHALSSFDTYHDFLDVFYDIKVLFGLSLKTMETGKVFKSNVPHPATAYPANRNFSLVRPISMKSKML